jgi:hypothetical protein
MSRLPSRLALRSLALLAVLVLGLSACRTATIQNINQAPVMNTQGKALTMDEVESAIKVAGAGLGWQMERVSPGHIVGTLNLRSHQAVVDIPYDTANYSIVYKDSTNLKHEGIKIHSNYNNWVNNLNRAIQRELTLRMK